MASSLWQRIIALSDSQHTADFQRICGIKSLEFSEQNGKCTSTNNHNGHSSTNEFPDNEVRCDSHNTNGDTHHVKNGSLPYQNGSVNSSHSPLKNRHGQKNGFVVHNGVANGDVSHLHNGSNACKCQNGSSNTKASLPNGFTHTPRDSSADSARNTDHTPKYKVENKLLYYIFLFGASLGNEIFYIVYFSFGLWSFDSYIFRRVSVVWCVVMYVGQAAKDLICWPRPTSPPAIRLEGRYELEYGMPSTHAMVGVVIPYMAVYYSYGQYEYNLFVGLFVATVWSGLVSFSRLYLGMHSVLDILAGIVGALILMVVCTPFVDALDCLLIAHPWCFPGLNLLCLGLCLAYPQLKEWSTARGDTTQVLACFSGIYQGMWLMARVTTLEMAEEAVLTAHTGWAMYACGVARHVLGLLILVFVLEGLKKLVVYIMATLMGLDPKDPRSKQHLSVELIYKYIGYFTPCFCAAYTMPVLFQYLGIHRGGYLLELRHHSHHFGL